MAPVTPPVEGDHRGRRQRSELSAPANSERFFATAAGAAEAVVLDLEDGTTPERKDAARTAAIGATNSLADHLSCLWGEVGALIALRVAESAGELVLPAPVPRLTGTPAALRHAVRAKGADMGVVPGERLGLVGTEIEDLRRAGAV